MEEDASMAELTATQYRWLHDELPDTVTDADLQDRYDRVGTVRDVALSVLRDQRSELLKSPLSVSVSGAVSLNSSENVKAIERQIASLSRLDDDPTSTPGEVAAGEVGGFSQHQMTRSRGR